jgi:hypothetical protein
MQCTSEIGVTQIISSRKGYRRKGLGIWLAVGSAKHLSIVGELFVFSFFFWYINKQYLYAFGGDI